MPVREKPKKMEASEDKALEFIKKGGTIAGEQASQEPREKRSQIVNVKIPIGILNRIDASVDKRELPIYRVQWILEAIAEKLGKENS